MLTELNPNTPLRVRVSQMPDTYHNMTTILYTKNSGHLWLAHSELQGGFNTLQLIPVDSGHFKEPSLWQHQVRIWACSGNTSYPKGSWAIVD